LGVRRKREGRVVREGRKMERVEEFLTLFGRKNLKGEESAYD